jgi:hypothetical protein
MVVEASVAELDTDPEDPYLNIQIASRSQIPKFCIKDPDMFLDLDPY